MSLKRSPKSEWQLYCFFTLYMDPVTVTSIPSSETVCIIQNHEDYKFDSLFYLPLYTLSYYWIQNTQNGTHHFPCCGYTFRCHLWTMWFMFAWWGWQENASVRKFCFLADDDNDRIYSLMWPVNHGHAQHLSHSLFNSVNTWGNENSRTLSLWNFRLLPQCSRDLQSPDLLSSIGCLSMMFWGSILVLSWPSETRLMCCLKSSVTN